MPFHDTIQQHLTDEAKLAIDRAIDDLAAALQPYLRNLSPEERQKYGSINEKNKLLVNKVWDYRQTQPELSSPDVKWDEFGADYGDRHFLETRMNRLTSYVGQMDNTKILHDYDNYQNSLVDYNYTKYKVETDVAGFELKQAELQQFFPNTGGGTGGNDTATIA